MPQEGQDLFIFNSLTRQRERFEPLEKGEVRMYVCGITPYDQCHLGHARCYVVFDMIRRTLERFGYNVKHIQNFTDVDDKIINRAKERGEDPRTLAQHYIDDYFKWMDMLGVQRAHEYPRVTNHIPDIIRLIEHLEKVGLAYEVPGGVYYSVRGFKAYGRLSGRSLDSMIPGSRVEVDPHKKDPLDFALWKESVDPSEIGWDSPWGRGRPGWHIECSAMSMKYLGEDFDIHGGGQDLTFPHHENEIAQSCGATGKGFAKYWLHNGFVNVDTQKMSKSLGNFFTLQDVLSKFDPMVVRYFLLSQHYRSPIDFSDGELKAAQVAWERVSTVLQLGHELESKVSSGNVSHSDVAKDSLRDFDDALADDFNTPRALSQMHLLATYLNAQLAKNWVNSGVFRDTRLVLETMTETLGLCPPRNISWPPEILKIVDEREAARKAKDWVGSDRFRDKLREMGVLVEDTPQGPRLKKIS